LRDLQSTDPRIHKERIEDSKDHLLRDSYAWILDDQHFRDWWDSDDTKLLWIKGNPGKGKTMMMIGLVDELSKRLKTKPGSGILSYFFCQSTDDRFNNAISVLRGLIYLLVVEQRTLIRHVRNEYDIKRKQLFEGEDAFYALRRIILEMLKDPGLPRVYLMLDALDECDSGLPQLLDLITSHGSELSPRVKWLVASRDRPDIKERLRPDELRLKTDLELNSHHISSAVHAFIDFKVSELAKRKSYKNELREKVKSYLYENAEETFLWVALVCKELQKVEVWNTESVLEEFPPGLEPLYERMMRQIQRLNHPKDVDFCIQILSSVTLTFRPIHLKELVATAGLPENLSNDPQWLNKLVDLCGSFLTVRKETIYFVHQSAKDYFNSVKGSKIFPSGQAEGHRAITYRCLQLMSDTLKRNICGLEMPGTLLNEANSSVNLNPLAHIRYACCYWVDHLGQVSHLQQDEIGKVHGFLQKNFLHWLEALSLIGEMSKGVLMMSDLQSLLAVSDPMIILQSQMLISLIGAGQTN
jgi:NACHT domain